MRGVVQSSILISVALLAGCAADKVAGPSRAPGAIVLDRGESPAARSLQFTTIDVPAASGTSAQGINARGDIVGNYADAGGSHGFLLRDGQFTSIDFPGAAGSEAHGIGPSGEIVGDYWFPGEPAVNVHGYLRTQSGDIVPVNFPGHTNDILQRILPDGSIFGCRHDGDRMATMRGIEIASDGASEIDEFASMSNGATPDRRRIAGLWTNMMNARTEGFIIDDGVFQTFVVPGSTSTAAWDVSPSGDIVGVYRTGTGPSTVVHGFLRRDRRADDEENSMQVEYVPVEYPGATATQAFGINARGEIVGAYVLAGHTHGFVARFARDQ